MGIETLRLDFRNQNVSSRIIIKQFHVPKGNKWCSIILFKKSYGNVTSKCTNRIREC